MHFQVVMTVQLESPLEIEPSDVDEAPIDEAPAIGYVQTFGVHADDFAEAVTLAQSALRSAAVGKALEGELFQAEALRIEAEDWPEEVLSASKNLDRKGVYFQSGMMFFSDQHGECEGCGECKGECAEGHHHHHHEEEE